MYDIPDFFLVANPIDRYSIGDRTPGLVHGDDGSLTIVLQHDEPTDADARANWLPTPAGAFRPILRMYEPASRLRRRLRAAPGHARWLTGTPAAGPTGKTRHNSAPVQLPPEVVG